MAAPDGPVDGAALAKDLGIKVKPGARLGHMDGALVPAILLLVSLAGVNLGDHHKKVLWRACVVSLLMLLVGVLVGAIPFG